MAPRVEFESVPLVSGSALLRRIARDTVRKRDDFQDRMTVNLMANLDVCFELPGRGKRHNMYWLCQTVVVSV